jgi:aspartyl-tRNA(Asn)/glutamyl-tRNA(Gln) amidotransferase subunit A
MTRTVADAALLLDVVAGPDDRDRHSLPPAGISYRAIVQDGARKGQTKRLRGVHLAWSADLGYAEVDAEVKELAEAAAKRFADLGCRVEAANPGFPNPRESFLILFFNGDGAMLSAQSDRWRELVDPALVSAIDRLGQFSAQDYARATFTADTVWEAMRRFLTSFDALLTPTVAVPAFPVERIAPAEIAGQPADSSDWLPFTYPFNLTGQPAATVPAGFTRSGLPVGLQIVGRRHDDATVLRLAAAYEAAFPWAGRRPLV